MQYKKNTNENILFELKNVDIADRDDTIFYNISLTLENNQKTFLTGHNDYQRTLLIHTILGLNKIQKGLRYLFNNNIDKISLFNLIELRKKIGYLHPKGGLLKNLSLIENIKIPLSYSGNYKTDETDQILRNIITFLELDDIIGKDQRVLTAYETKKILLARAIINRPKLLILDEPTLYIEFSDTTKIKELIDKIIYDFFNNSITLLISSDDYRWIDSKKYHNIILNNGIIQKKICTREY